MMRRCCLNCDISEREYSSVSEINVKVLSGGEQSVSSDEGENFSDNSKLGAWHTGKVR
jgi:hypothetical protein